MIDWLTIIVALVIIVILIAFFGFLAWKINMSDPLTLGKSDDQNILLDSNNEKRKSNEQSKKKRKDQKKSKRDNKDEEMKQQTKSKEPSAQTSEETDDEREESEQESSTTQTTTIETSSKARKRNKNKTATTTPAPSTEKNPVTIRAPPVTHPKSATKDEVGSTKQQAKLQAKSGQGSNKPTVPTVSSSAATAATKKSIPSVTTNQTFAKHPVEQEQPFTVVGGNRHKNGTSTPSAQQQNKIQANTNTTVVAPAAVQVQHEPLVQRQPQSPRETTTQVNGLPTNSLPNKQLSVVSTKLADLVKILPSSQVVVTELMSALDAFPLSSNELDIIMHKIANKQSVIKQDWSKLQHGQKVDPQAHIGQAMDESTKAYQEDMKSNSIKRVNELTDELRNEKHRIADLLKEKTDKEREIQILHAQLDSIQNKQPALTSKQQQQQNQTMQLQLQRVTEENIHLRQQLTQQQATASNPITDGDGNNVQLRVLIDQTKKLSVDNANLNKKASKYESLAEETHKQKDDLIRYNEQLTQSLEKIQKDFQLNEKAQHEAQTSHQHELNEYKKRLEQLEKDNEQLRREEIVHVEPTAAVDVQTITIIHEEREQLENEIHQLKQSNNSTQQSLDEKEREYQHSKQQWAEELEQYKKKYDDLQVQRQTEENELRQEIERLKQDKNHEQQHDDQARHHELTAKTAQIDTLHAEMNELKAQHNSAIRQSDEHHRQKSEKQYHLLADLLPQDLRHQLSNDHQEFDQWFASYRNIFESHLKSNKQTWEDECSTLKRENEQLHRNMNDVENQLKEIEQTVQTKEELLLAELTSKDVVLNNILGENERLNGELQRLRSEIECAQYAHDASVNEARTLKMQLDQQFLVAANTPPVVADESFELIKQPSPSLSPIIVDIRTEQLNELIRSSKEALETQDSITQQLDRHLDDMHRSGTGETSTSHVDGNRSSSSDQHQNQS